MKSKETRLPPGTFRKLMLVVTKAKASGVVDKRGNELDIANAGAELAMALVEMETLLLRLHKDSRALREMKSLRYPAKTYAPLGADII